MSGLPDRKARNAAKRGYDRWPVSAIGHEGHPTASRATQLGRLIQMGLVDYEEAWTFQRNLVAERQAEQCLDTLLLLEHEPVFTLGRTSHDRHWGGSREVLQTRGFAVYAVERGGSVTYHGPGQIVGYPILRLKTYCAGPRAYVDKLEEVIIRVLAEWGIAARRVEKWRGVWVEGTDKSLQKIASVGVRITHGVTMHGFALNVNVDLAPFALVTPCGIEGCRVTSMASVLGNSVEQSQVQQRIVYHFGDVFGLSWIHD